MTTKYINLNVESGTFRGFFQKLRGDKNFNSIGISKLRKLFSNERARILYTIKTQNPRSLYHLTKLLGRDFRTVREDINLLEKFGFIELDLINYGKREILKPILVVDKVVITIGL